MRLFNFLCIFIFPKYICGSNCKQTENSKNDMDVQLTNHWNKYANMMKKYFVTSIYTAARLMNLKESYCN